jgi:hypothetical protein
MAVQLTRNSSGWIATICWEHGSLKIFADSRDEALRKSRPFVLESPFLPESTADTLSQ